MTSDLNQLRKEGLRIGQTIFNAIAKEVHDDALIFMDSEVGHTLFYIEDSRLLELVARYKGEKSQ